MISEGAEERAIRAIRAQSQGLTAAEAGGAPAPAPAPMVTWRDAKETADVSISALQTAPIVDAAQMLNAVPSGDKEAAATNQRWPR